MEASRRNLYLSSTFSILDKLVISQNKEIFQRTVAPKPYHNTITDGKTKRLTNTQNH